MTSSTSRPSSSRTPAPTRAAPSSRSRTTRTSPAAPRSSTTATEQERLNVVRQDEEDDLQEELDAIEEAADPDADRAVDEALEVHDPADYEAAAEATEDESDEAFEEAAASGDGATVAAGIAADVAEDELDDEVEVDPYAAFRTELRGKLGKWYVIHSYAGFEKRVKQNIEQRKTTLAQEDAIYEVQVPMEDVVEIKNGQRKLVNRVRIPGYVLVRMDLNEESWSLVRHTPGRHRLRRQRAQPDPAALQRGVRDAEEHRRDRGGARQGRRRRRPRAAAAARSVSRSPPRSTSRPARRSRSRRARSRASPARSARSSRRAASSPSSSRSSSARRRSSSPSTRSPSCSRPGGSPGSPTLELHRGRVPLVEVHADEPEHTGWRTIVRRPPGRGTTPCTGTEVGADVRQSPASSREKEPWLARRR